jgi:hypothetical protein
MRSREDELALTRAVRKRNAALRALQAFKEGATKRNVLVALGVWSAIAFGIVIAFTPTHYDEPDVPPRTIDIGR